MKNQLRQLPTKCHAYYVHQKSYKNFDFWFLKRKKKSTDRNKIPDEIKNIEPIIHSSNNFSTLFHNNTEDQKLLYRGNTDVIITDYKNRNKLKSIS